MRAFYIADVPLWGGFWRNTVAVWLEHRSQTPLSTLDSLQRLVDGYVDCVVPGNEPTVDMWVNDEGLYRPDFYRNAEASYLARTVIVGPVVLAKSNPNTGETLGLDEAELFALSEKHNLGWDGTTYLIDEIVNRNRDLREALTV